MGLEDSHPLLHTEFQRGNFFVRRVPGRFNKLSPDQVIEQTINKDQKRPGGIKGFSTTEGTVQRWVLSSHSVFSINADLVGTYLRDQILESLPKDLSKERMTLDERKISKCYQTLSDWINPFKHSNGLCHLSSGTEVLQKTCEDLITAHEKGAQRLEEFLQKRIESNEVGFYEPITKLKLQTFSSLQKVKSVQIKDQTVAVKSDRQTFARLLMVQQNRNIDIKHVLNYELGSVPHSIANQDGTLRKSVKSKLLDFFGERHS